ncbi:MAG: hypothetical protein WCH98_00250 [Verrucomicrobiota bacterium]
MAAPIELWRTVMSSAPIRSGCKPLDLRFLFPGGRQALTACLFEAGLTRNSRVAFPEWSSHCVLSALGKCATPVPMAEVVQHGIKIDALMFYEQWGWPFPKPAWDDVNALSRGAAVIVDRVDSATPTAYHCSSENIFEVASLSKLLGLPGGGLGKKNGSYLDFKPGRLTTFTKVLRDEFGPRIRDVQEYKDHFKSSDQAVNPAVLRWVSENCLDCALDEEGRARRLNLELVIESPLSVNWPGWMAEAVRVGATPGIAPILRGGSPNKMRTMMGLLGERFQTQSAIYNFNWSGNPVRPSYEPCLAVPVHGMVRNLEEILREIGRNKSMPG